MGGEISRASSRKSRLLSPRESWGPRVSFADIVVVVQVVLVGAKRVEGGLGGGGAHGEDRRGG